MVRILIWLFLLLRLSNAWINQNKAVEDVILKKYDSRHRPVKQESATLNIQVYLMINHIEKVDEKEQTMLLHGVLWAVWQDEYLKWDPQRFNNTRAISIDPWKIWQPSFALYNSAKGNNWLINMYSMPATLSYEGRIYSSGTYSFEVTCAFDFSNYPYDEQTCPIVLADWVYDLSKVNLSHSAVGKDTKFKPAIRLSFDPTDPSPKKHVSGWEVIDSWQRHCYWGPQACNEEHPAGVLDNYWSLLEFGVRVKRHAPYYQLTIVLPTLIATLLTLVTFWIEDYPLAICLAMVNSVLQGLFGWSMIRELPPGTGSLPKIVDLYALNLCLTGATMFLHTLFHFLIHVLPEDLELPYKLTDATERLRGLSFFKVQGLSFDPQTLFTESFERPQSNGPEQRGSDVTLVETSEDELVQMEPMPTDNNSTAVSIPDEPESTATTSDVANLVSFDDIQNNTQTARSSPPDEREVEESEKPTSKASRSHLEEEFYVLRRVIFFLFLLILIIVVPACIF